MRNMRGGSASFLLGAAAPSASIRRPLIRPLLISAYPHCGERPATPPHLPKEEKARIFCLISLLMMLASRIKRP